ncbi:tail fiber protein [Pseudomonas sp. zjy_14]|uniref:gp53-like domain-containing protein n=1 Tax=Pseudomonas sp. zjy_14 TaxID=3367264 RepID=UPI00370B29AD
MYRLGSGSTLNRPLGWSGSVALNLDYTDYAYTLACNLGGAEALAFRRKDLNGFGEWRSVWHSGNFDPAGKADKATTLAGYGIVDGATKTELGTKAPLASPAFTGIPTVPTAAAGTNSWQTANCAFVQNAIAALVASSPAALDTLNELAAAIGNDPNFATTMVNALAGKANKATTLAGYGIVDGATKTEVNAKTSVSEANEIARDVGFRARASLPPGTAGVNFNNIVTPGCYEYIVYGTHANGPGAAAYFYVEVYEYSAGVALTQRLIPYTGKGGTWTRTRYDGTWGDWDKDVSEFSLPALLPIASASREGILKLNHSITSTDQATAASSYALKQVRDLAYNKGAPSTASLLVNGWSKDNDTGEMEQWGVVTGVADNTMVSVTFPTAFPVECLNGQVTFASDPGTSGSDVTGFLNATRTGFTLRVSGNNTTNSVYWRAKGR